MLISRGSFRVHLAPASYWANMTRLYISGSVQFKMPESENLIMGEIFIEKLTGRFELSIPSTRKASAKTFSTPYRIREGRRQGKLPDICKCLNSAKSY